MNRSIAHLIRRLCRPPAAAVLTLLLVGMLTPSAFAQFTTTTVRSGNGAPGSPDAQVRALVISDGRVLTAQDFIDARSAPFARVINPYPGFSTLPTDPAARYINDNGSTNAAARVLYAVEFDIGFAPLQSTLAFSVATDDQLGGNGNVGLYLNGQPIPGSASGYTAYTPGNYIYENVGSLLQAGTNTLYLYYQNSGGGPGMTAFSGSFNTSGATPVSGASCATAYQLNPTNLIPATLRGSNAGNPSAVLNACRGSGVVGPVAWYRLSGDGRPVTVSTCEGTNSFDTVISVFCGPCGSADQVCIAANDDDCGNGASRVTFCTTAGNEYYIAVSGFAGASGTFDLRVLRSGTPCTDAPACAPCRITIPAGAIAENEPACGPGYTDNFNAGCSVSPARYSSIAPGQTIAGKAGTFIRGGQDFRDTDWYEFTLTQPAEVLLVGRGDFPMHLGLIDGRTACTPEIKFDFGESRSAACEDASIRIVLPAGRFIAFAAPSALSGIPCGSNYLLTLATTPVGACAFSSGCSTLTAAACAAAGGAYNGDNSPCADVGYTASVLPFTFDDIAASGTAISFSNLDDGGATISPGFPFTYFGSVYTQVGVSTNGYLRFGQGDLDFPLPRSTPDTRRPNNIIAPRWSNLNLDPATPSVAGGGSVRWQVLGAAPTRRLVVQWTNVRQFGFTDTNTFQAVLFEGDGSIEFRYLTVQPAAFNGQLVAGLENFDGTRGTTVAAGQAANNTRVALRKGNLIAPIAVAGGPYTLSASVTSMQVSALGSSDPDGALPGFAGIRTVQWDLGADGIGDDAARTNAQETFTLTQALAKGLSLTNPVTLRLSVTDFDNLIANDQTLIAYANTAPTVVTSGPFGPIVPGGQAVLGGTITDPDDALNVNETFTIEWATRRYTVAGDFGSSSTFATGLTPTVPYSTFLNLANSSGVTIWLNIRDRSGAIAAASTTFSINLPDLAPATPVTPASASFGTRINVTLPIVNSGGGAATGSWHDRVYLSTDATVSGDDVLLGDYRFDANNIAPGTTGNHDFNLDLPVRFTGGIYRLIFITDIYNQLAESSDANNTVASNVISLAPTPAADLVVSSASGPTDGTWGQPLSISFLISNSGDTPASSAFVDGIYINTQPNLSGATFLATEPGPASLDVGASYNRTLSVATPVNPTGGGNWYIVVRTDNNASILEPDENNNVRATGVIRMEATNSVNLTVQSVTAPPAGIAGRPIDVAWTVRNTGQASAVGSWFDRIVLRNPADNTEVTLGEFRRDGPLTPGTSYNSTQIVRLPGDIQGPRFVCVVTDATNTVSEPQPGAEADNRTCAATNTVITLPSGPDFIISSTGLASANPVFGGTVSVQYTLNNIGDQPATGTWTDRIWLSRDANLSSDDISLGFSDTAGPLDPDSTVDRAAQVALPLSADLVSGTYYIIVAADASLNVQERLENNNAAASAPIVINRPTLPNLVALSVPPAPAGAPGQTVQISWQVRNSGTVETPARWTERVVASPDGTTDGPLLALFTNTTAIAASTTVTRTASITIPNLGTGYVLKLCVDAGNEVLESVETDNCNVSGPAVVNRPDLTVEDFIVPSTAVADSTVAITYTTRNIGAAATSGSFLENLYLVSLTTGQETLLDSFLVVPQLPAGGSAAQNRSVTIPTRFLGQYIFKVITDATDTNIESGPTANNTRTAATPTIITQPARPNLVITGVETVASGLVGSSGSVTFTVQNIGTVPVGGAWGDRIVAVRTDAPGEVVLSEVAQTAGLAAGGSRARTTTFSYPSTPGTYRIRVIADRADTVYEDAAGETDNVFNSTSTFVSETFTVTADANITAAVSGTPVVITGTARTTGGNPVPSTPVEVRVVVQGTSREIRRPGDQNIVTDTSGNYSVTFNPVPTEGGLYSVLAGPRGAVPPTVRDTFILNALNLPQSAFNIVLQSAAPASVVIPLVNPGDTAISGVQASISGDTTDLTVGLTTTPTITGGTNGSVTVNLTAATGTVIRRVLTISITSAQGNTLTAFINVEARPLQPTLVVTPGSLSAQVVRGQQTLVSFRLENIGAGTASGMSLQLPGIPWISASTPSIPDLAGGQGVDLTLRLAPADSVPLSTVTGNLAVSNAAGTYGVNIPYNFRVVSQRLTSLVVRVEDERSFYDANGNYIPSGGPMVENAVVKLRDSITGDVLFQSITSRPSGGGDVQAATFTDIPEQLYNITVEAERHGNYSANVLVEEDGDPSFRVFIPFQAVRFNWIVEETQVTEVTLITLEAVYETFVPAPVITITPSLIDLANYPSGGQIDITVTNHGLVAAEDVGVDFSSHPLWRLTPLVNQFGRLGPNQSRTIPVTIERLEGPGGPETPCTITAGVHYALVCIGRNLYSIPIPVINISGDCGSPTNYTWGGGGGFGGFGGGGGGGGFGASGSFSYPISTSNPSQCRQCDPNTFQEQCMSRDFSASLNGYIGTLVSAVTAAFPGLDTDVDFTVSGDGQICTCCRPDGGISLKARGQATGSLSITLSTPGNEINLPGSYSMNLNVGGTPVPVTVGFQARAGCELLRVTGTLQASGETECGFGEPRICVTGTAELAPLGSCSLSATMNGTVTGGPYAGYTFTAGIGATIETNASLSASISSCQEPPYNLCVRNDIKLRILLPTGVSLTNAQGQQVVGDVPSPEMVFQLYGPNCASVGYNCCPESPGGINLPAFTPPSQSFNLPKYASISVVRAADPPEDGNGLCAQVRLQMEQSIAITRTAVSCTLEIDNSLSTTPVENLRVELAVFDENGVDRTSLFGISTRPTLQGVTGVDGTGVVPAGRSGRSNWIVLPTNEAAPTVEKRYFFGGYVSYSQAGAPRSFVLTPTGITVRPDPRIQVKYFLQRDVYSDDPFTPEVEPAEPFSLGLMLTNSGYGTGRNVTITSSQPRIVENGRDLLIDFQIIGSQIGDQSFAPSLTMNFGDLPPQTTKVGRYVMTTTLLGQFTDFSATYRRRDDYGISDDRVALIDSVTTYDLIHAVRDQRAGADTSPDFLTDELTGLDDPNENPDVPVLKHLPDRVHLSDGTVQSVTSILNPTLTPLSGGQYRMTFAAPQGYFYSNIADPFNATLRLTRVVRSDGRELAIGYNFWQTDRVFRDRQQPLRDYRVHIFDDGGTGTYTLYFDSPPAAPVISAWFAQADHGSPAVTVAIPADAATGDISDPRLGGPQRLVFSSNSRINPSAFSTANISLVGRGIDGGSVDLSGVSMSTSLLPGGTGGVITFNQPLPRKVRYCVNLVGVTDVFGRFVRGQTRILFGTVPGDATSDRQVTTGDVSAVRYRIGAVISDPSDFETARCDLNRDGLVDEADLALATSGGGLDMRWIADPCFGLLIAQGGDPWPPRPAPALVYDELEPNNTYPNATRGSQMTYRDSLTGNSQGAAAGSGSDSSDLFRVTAAPLPLGIYRHRLQLAPIGADLYSTALLGRTQTGGTVGPLGSAVLQQVSPPNSGLHYNQFYDFGRSGEVAYLVSGTAATTSDYTVTLKTEPVSPVPLGEFPSGAVTISTVGRGHNTDTKLMLYGSSLLPVPDVRSDDAAAGVRGSTITVGLGAGTYFLAISDVNTADDQPDVPGDFATGRPVSDYPGILVNSSTATNVPLHFAITAGGVTETFQAFKPERFGVYFAAFSLTGCAADLVSAGGIPVPDGIIDGEDFIAFINSFALGDASVDPLADIDGDGTIDGNDFITFINTFGGGC
jgi:hypothetical protein